MLPGAEADLLREVLLGPPRVRAGDGEGVLPVHLLNHPRLIVTCCHLARYYNNSGEK